MLAWKHLDSSTIPGQGGTIHLYCRGDEFSIRLDNYELMNSRLHGSEDSLAELACAGINHRSAPRVLIGGLGMGYTLAAALVPLSQKAQVVVAELVPAVVVWNRGPLAQLAGSPLEDHRVSVCEGDVGEIIRQQKRGFDAILLDVDNGPEGLTRPENDRLYGLAGLNDARKALRSGGVLAVWSASPDKKFSQRLTKAGFKVEEVQVKARKGSKGKVKHTIWLGT